MNESIGNRIAKYRKMKGMTQEELANMLGVSSQAVSKWETDSSCPDISLVAALCGVLGITADELLTGNSSEVKRVPVEQRKRLDEMILRVKVKSGDGDQIRLNLPMSLVKLSFDMGYEVVTGINGMDAMKNINWSQIVNMAENGAIGKIIEVESSDGDLIEVTVE